MDLEGTGKSILALHLASRYAADCLRRLRLESADNLLCEPSLPRILYISSDLKAAGADEIWKAFGLDKPNQRQIPFERNMEGIERFVEANRALELDLKPLWPSADKIDDLVEEVLMPKPYAADNSTVKVTFLDLATHTAGDDWSLVNAFLVKLQSVKSAMWRPGDRQHPHLVVIDSVAGFETFVGKVDAYGTEQSRRSRIAQCLRNAGHRVSIVFVVEGGASEEHMPEEYVTDVVLSLRKRTVSGNTTLTLEVQKARAQEHAQGEHPFEIRDRNGTSTGRWENLDAPRTRNSYVQVFASIAHRNHIVSADWVRPDFIPGRETSGFGIPYLDELLPAAEGETQSERVYGLRAGTVTALIGDPSTGKSALGERFLAYGFTSIIRQYLVLSAMRDFSWAVERDSLRDVFQSIADELALDIVNLRRSCSISRGGGSPDRWPGLLGRLEGSINYGRKETEKSLGSIFSGTPPPSWKDREEASTLAKPNEGGAKNPNVNPPKSRWGWTVDWKSVAGGNLMELFRHPNLRRPGVLLTTRDRRGFDVVDTCFAYLQTEIDEAFAFLNGDSRNDITDQWRRDREKELREVLDAQLVVRRFDLKASSASAVFHLIHRNLTETQKLVFGLAFPPYRDDRSRKAGRIRVVIDDLRVLAHINPDLIGETAFLPFLAFLLEREGVVSLLVHTDSLRPNSSPEDEVSKGLLSILKRAILTWNVPFQGRRRIAISVIPHNRSDKNGIVRELTLDSLSEREDTGSTVSSNQLNRLQDVAVTRHLELYSGIEEGRPTPVPLAVYLFDETPECGAYIALEDKLFRELFISVERRSPIRPGRILFSFDTARYLAIRDRTNLMLNMQEAHTLVIQVDEHWALHEAHALENLGDYLTRKLSKFDEDPFGVFSGSSLDVTPEADCVLGEPKVRCRRGYFQNQFYKGSVEALCKDHECRVPYMWDFGFLLARRAPWETVSEDLIVGYVGEIAEDDPDTKRLVGETIPIKRSNPSDCEKVRIVFDYLSGRGTEGGIPRAVSWRKFLGACKQVAFAHREQTAAGSVPFEIAAPSSETINSLVLEMWLSELALEARLLGIDLECFGFERSTASLNPPLKVGGEFRIKDAVLGEVVKRCEPERCNERGTGRGTIENAFEEFAAVCERGGGETSEFKKLPVGAFCLYKVWLLLSEVIEFEKFIDRDDPFAVRQGMASSVHAVASRHWYKTACTFSKELYSSAGIHDSLVAMRLPGSYCTRGDWFLGYTKSSRSRLLAEHAIDLLSSRRGNITRMQHGLGLPVRDFVSDEKCGEFRTALLCRMEEGNQSGKQMSSPIDYLSYGELCRLGKNEKGPGIEWLFRSRIRDYDRLSRPLQKWLARVFRWSGNRKKTGVRGLKGGFAAYDELTSKRPTRAYEGFVEFGRMCDLLIAGLEAAERGEN